MQNRISPAQISLTRGVLLGCRWLPQILVVPQAEVSLARGPVLIHFQKAGHPKPVSRPNSAGDSVL